jgi:hypothetical protein
VFVENDIAYRCRGTKGAAWVATRNCTLYRTSRPFRPEYQVPNLKIFNMAYGEGVSKMGELIDLGVAAGVVEKSGAWFSYDGQRIGQGRENAKNFLRENVEMAKSIEAAIRQNAGLVAGAMMDSGGGKEASAYESFPGGSGRAVISRAARIRRRAINRQRTDIWRKH